MLIPQQILKVFGLYLGADCVLDYDSEIPTPAYVEGVDLDTGTIIVERVSQKPSEVKLLLSSVRDISSDHVKGLAAICHIHGEFKIEKGDHSFVISNEARKVIIYYSGSNPRITDMGVEIIEYSSQIFDYLRATGYMLPYMGVDLFTEGIAVDLKREQHERRSGDHTEAGVRDAYRA